ncbi:MAG: hypothetical protein GEU83_09940 [Pseudonocardiaceae bacterium]|nr:hypothetical protein [Pseudonocardiaceae bacterium]
MIREDRELLAELARVNTDVVPLAMRVMDDSATAEEQQQMAGRLTDLGQRLRERAGRAARVIEGRVVAEAAHVARGAVPNPES